MPDQKLVGQNYTTPDLIAKVTGRAKYAEDYKAEGMLWCKLLISPMPHARVRRLNLDVRLRIVTKKEVRLTVAIRRSLRLRRIDMEHRVIEPGCVFASRLAT